MSSTSSILRPEIVVVGNRSYRINPPSLPGLESIEDRQHQVYREEDEADYFEDNPDDDEPTTCRPQPNRTTTDQIEKPPIGIILKASVFPCKSSYKNNIC